MWVNYNGKWHRSKIVLRKFSKLRSSHRRCSIKKVSLKNSQNSQDCGTGFFSWILQDFKNIFFIEHPWIAASANRRFFSANVVRFLEVWLNILRHGALTLSWRNSLSYRKNVHWFPYNKDIHHERIKEKKLS